jgi:hypothetical protein
MYTRNNSLLYVDVSLVAFLGQLCSIHYRVGRGGRKLCSLHTLEIIKFCKTLKDRWLTSHILIGKTLLASSLPVMKQKFTVLHLYLVKHVTIILNLEEY